MTERVRLLVYGAGGHGLVVVDAALSSGRVEIVGVLDDDASLHGGTLLGVPVVGGAEIIERAEYRGCAVVLAVGRADHRRALDRRLTALGVSFHTVVHPSAFVGREASLGEGTVVLPMAVVHSRTSVGRHAIVNTAATIDHDGKIGDYAHVAPGAHLAGGVCVGTSAHVGIGAAVAEGICIGDGAIVGAGAAVVDDVPPGAVVGGVPARPLGKEGRG